MRLTIQNEALVRKLRKAREEGQLPAYGEDMPGAALAAGLVSETEAEQLRNFERALRRAIDVDDFEPDALWAAAGATDAQANAA